MSITWDIELDFEPVTERVFRVIPDGLHLAMEHLRTASAPQVPIETGRLVGSADPRVDTATLTGSLSYAGPYARYQHEELQLRHPHGNAKYLELPLYAEADAMREIVAEAIRGVW